MALVEVLGAETPIILIPGHFGERGVVDIVAKANCKAGLAMTMNTFLDTITTLSASDQDSKK